MSRVDEALGRAAALAGTQPGTPLLPGHEFEPANTVDLWPAEAPGEDPAPEPHATPAMQNFAPSDAPTEADEKLVSRLLDSRSVEQYRRLAARLHLEQAQRGTKVVMISSALPGEGKTLTAANIALTLSHSYKRRVLLIDGDLRRPWMHELFNVPNVTGLNDGIRSQVGHKVPLIRWSECLTLLTAGRPDSDPMSVLSSDRMKQIIAEASAAFDWVVIDTPPVGLLSDAHLLAAIVDTVIMVVQAGRTPVHDINKAVQTLGPNSIFGVVLNRVRSNNVFPYDDYYYSYAPKLLAE
jgi:capsular exopolysaccharide synthesis family protein